MESNKTSSLLRYAARRAAQNHFFLAEYLSEFNIIRGMTEDELAQFLGCGPRLLPKLALCRRPDPESSKFRSDVERIAISFDIQPGRLLQGGRRRAHGSLRVQGGVRRQTRPQQLPVVPRRARAEPGIPQPGSP